MVKDEYKAIIFGKQKRTGVLVDLVNGLYANKKVNK